MKDREARGQLLRFKLAFAAALLPLGALLALLLLADNYLNRPLPGLAEPRLFTIEDGTPMSGLSRRLREEGVIDHPFLFDMLARFRGLEQSIRQGEYELPAGATPAELLSLFVSGTTRQRRLTLIEGWTFAEALAKIRQSEGVEAVLKDLTQPEIARAMGLDTPSPEGMIFPDTYFYAAGATDLDLLLRARERLENILARQWLLRKSGLLLDSPYQALTLASIVEKEAAAGGMQRELIAGVFHSRLARGMKLQSDPTVIYGLGEEFDGNLRSANLEGETAYNTYRIGGLPPTPIALASLDSIRASLNPAPSNYLYFVADDQGGHYFSTNLTEHNNAVDCYQRKLDNGSCDRLGK